MGSLIKILLIFSVVALQSRLSQRDVLVSLPPIQIGVDKKSPAFHAVESLTHELIVIPKSQTRDLEVPEDLNHLLVTPILDSPKQFNMDELVVQHSDFDLDPVSVSAPHWLSKLTQSERSRVMAASEQNLSVIENASTVPSLQDQIKEVIGRFAATIEKPLWDQTSRRVLKTSNGDITVSRLREFPKDEVTSFQLPAAQVEVSNGFYVLGQEDATLFWPLMNQQIDDRLPENIRRDDFSARFVTTYEGYSIDHFVTDLSFHLFHPLLTSVRAYEMATEDLPQKSVIWGKVSTDVRPQGVEISCARLNCTVHYYSEDGSLIDGARQTGSSGVFSITSQEEGLMLVEATDGREVIYSRDFYLTAMSKTSFVIDQPVTAPLNVFFRDTHVEQAFNGVSQRIEPIANDGNIFSDSLMRNNGIVTFEVLMRDHSSYVLEARSNQERLVVPQVPDQIYNDYILGHRELVVYVDSGAYDLLLPEGQLLEVLFFDTEGRASKIPVSPGFVKLRALDINVRNIEGAIIRFDGDQSIIPFSTFGAFNAPQMILI